MGLEAFSISRTAATSSPRHPRASLDSALGFKVCNTTMTASGVAMRCISATTMFAPTISRTNAGSSRKVSPAKISRRSASRATRVVVRAEEEPARAKGPSTNQMLVFVPPHPLINHWLGIARNAMTPPAIFRSTLGELGRLLVYECVRDWLPTFTAEVEGPMATAQVEMVDPGQPVAVVPVLRAGLVLLEVAGRLLLDGEPPPERLREGRQGATRGRHGAAWVHGEAVACALDRRRCRSSARGLCRWTPRSRGSGRP